LAEALEKWIPLDMISEEISNELADSGFISSSYVRQVLAEKYKNKKKQTSISNSGATVLLNRDNTGANDIDDKGIVMRHSEFVRATDDEIPNRHMQGQFKELEVIEFDLKQAWEMGLKDAINECQHSMTESWLVKIFVRDGLVNRIENEITGFVRHEN